MKYISRWFNRLVNTGITQDLILEDRKRIQVCNEVTVFVFMISFVYIFVFLFQGLPPIFFLLLFIPMALYGGVFILNKYHRFMASRLLLIFTGNMEIAAIAFFQGYDFGNYLFLIPTAMSPFIFFSRKDLKYIIGGFAYTLILYSIVVVSSFYVPPFHELDPDMAQYFFILTYCSTLFTSIGFAFLLWFADIKAEAELEAALDIIRKDLKMAQNIQINILPDNYSSIKDLKIRAVYDPMVEVGGDFYDIEEISPGQVRVFLADATGHGVQAALLTMVIKGEYENLKHTTETPDVLFNKLNQVFIDKFYSLNTYFTCFLIDIDLRKNRRAYSSAGHLNQLLLNRNGPQPLSHTGSLIGLLPETVYEMRELDFEPGDRLLLFSDGLTEQFNPDMEEFGEERLLSGINQNYDDSINGIIESLLASMNKFLNKREKQDDITIIGIETAITGQKTESDSPVNILKE